MANEHKPVIHIVGSWVIMEDKDDTVIRSIKDKFSYTHVTFDYLNGTRQFDRISCYRVAFADGRFTLTIRKGFLPRLVNELNKLGVPYVFDRDTSNSDKYCIDRSYLATQNLRDEQEKCVSAILNSEGGIIDAPTGFGKSYLFPILCRLYSKASIDIVTKRKDVALQIYQNVLNVLPEVGLVTTGSKKWRRVTVYTSGSLKHSDFKADLVLLDECHELVTPNNLKCLLRYNKAIMFGFTASAKTRYDNAWFRLEELCGPVIYKLNYQKLQSRGSVVPIVIQWIPIYSGPVVSKYSSLVDRRRAAIWVNRTRNETIAKVARLYYEAGNQVLIITKTLEHALRLKQLLPEFVLCCSGVNSRQERKFARLGLPVDEARQSAKARKELANKFRNREIMGAIATEVWTTGMSFDDLEVLIRADADVSKTAAIQVPGRVCRLGLKIQKEAGLVVNFVDCFDAILYKRAVVLYRLYQNMGWTQCDADLNLVTKFPYSLMRIK